MHLAHQQQPLFVFLMTPCVLLPAENIRVKRPEWGANRLEAHLGDVMRHLGEAFARAGAAAAAGAGGRAQQPLQLPKLTAAGINLLQVRGVHGVWGGVRWLCSAAEPRVVCAGGAQHL